MNFGSTGTKDNHFSGLTSVINKGPRREQRDLDHSHKEPFFGSIRKARQQLELRGILPTDSLIQENHNMSQQENHPDDSSDVGQALNADQESPSTIDDDQRKLSAIDNNRSMGTDQDSVSDSNKSNGTRRNANLPNHIPDIPVACALRAPAAVRSPAAVLNLAVEFHKCARLGPQTQCYNEWILKSVEKLAENKTLFPNEPPKPNARFPWQHLPMTTTNKNMDNQEDQDLATIKSVQALEDYYKKKRKKVVLWYVLHLSDELYAYYIKVGNNKNFMIKDSSKVLTERVQDGNCVLLAIAMKMHPKTIFKLEAHWAIEFLKKNTFDRIRKVSHHPVIYQGMQKNQSYLVTDEWLKTAVTPVDNDEVRLGGELIDKIERNYNAEDTSFETIVGGARIPSATYSKLDFVKNTKNPCVQPKGSRRCLEYSYLSALKIMSKIKKHKKLEQCYAVIETKFRSFNNPNKKQMTLVINNAIQKLGYELKPRSDIKDIVRQKICKEAGDSALFIVEFKSDGQDPHCVAIFNNKIIDPVEEKLLRLTQENVEEICGKGHKYKGLEWCQVLQKRNDNESQRKIAIEVDKTAAKRKKNKRNKRQHKRKRRRCK